MKRSDFAHQEYSAKPFEKQRCLIPADGFYEWQTTTTGKQPFRFTMKGGGFFCMAGLWEKWIRPPRSEELNLEANEPSASQIVETFTIITTEPNTMVAAVLWLIIGAPEELDFLKGSKSTTDLKSFYPTDPKKLPPELAGVTWPPPTSK